MMKIYKLTWSKEITSSASVVIGSYASPKITHEKLYMKKDAAEAEQKEIQDAALRLCDYGIRTSVDEVEVIE